MPFWPLYIAASAGLTAWGWHRGSISGPLLALVGFVGMRVIVHTISEDQPALRELIGGTWWIAIGGAMIYAGWKVSGFFAVLSGLTYPVLAMIGARIVYLGILPVVADAFIILAMATIGGGLAVINSLAPDGLGRPAGLDGSPQAAADRMADR